MSKEKSAAEAPQAEPKRARVKAIEKQGHEWTHAGKVVPPGTVVDVDNDQAIRLYDAGLVEIL